MQEWFWAISYDNGETWEHEDTLIGFANVRINEVTNLIVHNDTITHSVIIPEDARPIFFRRRISTINLSSIEEPSIITKTICFGWQKTVNGVNVKSMNWLFSDGSILVTDKDIDEL